MSRFFEIQPKVLIGYGVAAIVGGSLAYAGYLSIRNLIDNQPPKKWRKVGSINEMWCFPVKSCGPIVMNEITCGPIGPEIGNIRDRVFMVVRSSGDFITARTYPKMVKIVPKIDGDLMTLSAPGMDNIQVNIAQLFTSTNTMKVKIWKDTADVIDCGDEVGSWFSRYILGEESNLRLVFYPSKDPKPYIADKKYNFETAKPSDTGALHDETSFMLMNQGSFDLLNSKLTNPVGPLQFRPNFVVKGPGAFEEDSWDWIKVGDVTFRNVQPCTRCIFTNIDPVTAERNPQEEPLKTLKTFRSFNKTGPSPVFGIHMGVRQQGKVKLGDTVFVGEK